MIIDQARRGFSLIELLVAVAIAAILMAIAVPSYAAFVKKGRRAAAQSCLVELSQFMERYYTTNLSYKKDAAAVPALPALSCTDDLEDSYKFDFADDQPTASTFVLEAVASEEQKTDGCGDLSVSNTGLRTPASPASCWP